MEDASENSQEKVATSNEGTEKANAENGSEVKNTSNTSEGKVGTEVFKKPQLIIGPRRGKAVGKIRNLINKPPEEPSDVEKKESTSPEETAGAVNTNQNLEADSVIAKNPETITCSSSSTSPAQKMKDNSIPLPYKEPKWGGIPKDVYGFEVLKNGKIVAKCGLGLKSFYVFGRLSTSDFHMTHPTISRHHAILQYRSQVTEGNPRGFYLFDLGSTHGTFLNKNRIKPNIYVPIRVGHMLKLGCSTRLFVLSGPEEDMEEESELSVSQLKEKRQMELATRELEELERKRLEEEKKQKEEEQGIDWGMGEDADEETDLTENPFAATQNEELYINDPKKTLRGWFEREGYDLEYDVEEKSFGQFLCRVELPIESSRGSTMVAEALVKGKKKEAVVQCALEACKMLDRYGLLRQATHESKKRKAKDWEAEDFYDSDEDTFLDRTGTVEKKRQQRMRAAGKKDPGEVVETYDSLVKKHNEVLAQLEELEQELHKVTMDVSRSTDMQDKGEEEEDALDAFMMELSKPAPDKKLVTRLKSKLAVLKQEEVRLRKLVNITKPANLPELKAPEETSMFAPEGNTSKKTFPMVGSRRKPSSKAKQVGMPETSGSVSSREETEVGEEEEEDDETMEESRIPIVSSHNKNEQNIEEKDGEVMEMDTDGSAEKSHTVKETKTKVLGPTMPPPEINMEVSEPEKNEKTRVLGPSMAPPEAYMEVEKEEKNERTKLLGSTVLSEENKMEITEEEGGEKNDNRKQSRKNKKRMQKEKNEKASQQKGDYDPLDPDYSTWVPPPDQTGDGRTKLNEKYGY